MSTKAAVSVRTTGKAKSSVGKATNQDTPQAPSHKRQKPGTQPMPLKVLMKDTMQVIKIDNNRGITKPA